MEGGIFEVGIFKNEIGKIFPQTQFTDILSIKKSLWEGVFFLSKHLINFLMDTIFILKENPLHH